MMKLFSRLSALLLAALLIAGVCVPALADENPSITVETEKAGLVFLPKTDHNDLFNNFKGCMPGDKLIQVIELKNLCKTLDWLTFSMKAEVHNEANPPVYTEDYVTMNEFLSRLSMTVKRGDTVIYEASPDEADGLADFLPLATLAYGESVALTVELTVPEGLGNEYMHRIGEVDWVFRAEGDIIPTPPPGPPTGDVNNAALWYALMGAGAALFILVIFIGRKKKSENKG